MEPCNSKYWASVIDMEIKVFIFWRACYTRKKLYILSVPYSSFQAPSGSGGEKYIDSNYFSYGKGWRGGKISLDSCGDGIQTLWARWVGIRSLKKVNEALLSKWLWYWRVRFEQCMGGSHPIKILAYSMVYWRSEKLTIWKSNLQWARVMEFYFWSTGGWEMSV